MKLKVLLVEDIEIAREAYRQLIDSTTNMICVAALPNAITVVASIKEYQPDVILMDINLPVKDGIEAVKDIRAAGINTPIMMQTIFDEDEKVFPAILAGANGYALKSTPEAQFLQMVQEAAYGGGPMTPGVAARVLKFLREKGTFQAKKDVPDDDITDGLTERQKEILEMLMDGASYKMIASELHIGIDTVRFHIKKIYAALHINSKGQLLRLK